jgi:hypothetical protein
VFVPGQVVKPVVKSVIYIYIDRYIDIDIDRYMIFIYIYTGCCGFTNCGFTV